MRLIVAAVLALVGLNVFGSGPSAAYPEPPWCVVSDINGPYWDCAFWTLPQCLATASGLGKCHINPAWKGDYRELYKESPAPVPYRPRRAIRPYRW